MRTFSPFNGKIMNDTTIHIDPLKVPESPVTAFMRSMTGLMYERDAEVYQMKQEVDHYKQQMQSLPLKNIVAEGSQSEIVALFNAIHARGLITCSKKEFMQRMADALGCPSIADYSRTLNKAKQTYKYEEVFDKLKETALQERDKND